MIRQSVVYQETIKQRKHIEKEFIAIKPVSIFVAILLIPLVYTVHLSQVILTVDASEAYVCY